LKSVVGRLELPEYGEIEDGRRLADLSIAAHRIVPHREAVRTETDGLVAATIAGGPMSPRPE
jgi:hypothetical protein